MNYARLSSIFISKRDFKRVIGICNEALKVEPDSEVFYINRGYAYANLNQPERAIEDYGKVIELNPNYAEAYANRGIAYSEIQRYEESARDLKKRESYFFILEEKKMQLRLFIFVSNCGIKLKLRMTI